MSCRDNDSARKEQEMGFTLFKVRDSLNKPLRPSAGFIPYYYEEAPMQETPKKEIHQEKGKKDQKGVEGLIVPGRCTEHKNSGKKRRVLLLGKCSVRPYCPRKPYIYKIGGPSNPSSATPFHVTFRLPSPHSGTDTEALARAGAVQVDQIGRREFMGPVAE